MSDRTQLELALEQIRFARTYTLSLIDDLADDDWLAQPAGCPTNIAWQVGHLTMAQYMLTLFRVRGKEPIDESLAPKKFIRRYLKGTTPSQDPPEGGIAGLRRSFDGVYEQVLAELGEYADDQLQEIVKAPYAVYNTQLGSVFFCSAHEMLHAGQIGLIRRLLGKPPVR